MRVLIFTIVLPLLMPDDAMARVFSYAIMGDSGVWNRHAKSVRASIREGRIQNLILPGDNLYLGRYDWVWRHWSEFQFKVVAIGNHNRSYEEEISYFQMPGEYYQLKPHEKLTFLVLNSDNQANIEAQARFLEDKLAGINQGLLFIVFHHPPYTVTDFHNWRERQAFHERIRPILHQNADKITALLVGHDHIATALTAGEIPIIVSGAVFETREARALDYLSSDGQRVRTQWLFNGEPHWVRLDADTETGHAWFNFVQAKPSQVVCTILVTKKDLTKYPNCDQ